MDKAPGLSSADAWRYFTFVVAVVGAVAIFLFAMTDSAIAAIITILVLAFLNGTAEKRLLQEPRFYRVFNAIALVFLLAAAVLPRWLDMTPLGLGQAALLTVVGAAPMFAVAIWLGARTRR